MKFGLFGSAQAQRGGPDMDSGQGFRDFIEYNVEAEALGYTCTFAVEHHFTGFGQVSATLNLLTWVAARTTHAAARHRGDGAAVAQSGAARRAGRDARPAVGRPARFRHRQGLPPQRVRGLLHPDGGGRRAVRGRPRRDPQVVDLGRSASRTTASTGISRMSWSSRRRRRSRTRRSGWGRAVRRRSPRSRTAASSCCSTSTRRSRP